MELDAGKLLLEKENMTDAIIRYATLYTECLEKLEEFKTMTLDEFALWQHNLKYNKES